MKLTENDAVGFLESMRHPDEKQQTKLKEISKNITLIFLMGMKLI